MFDNYINLIKSVDEKFETDSLVLRQVPPLEKYQNNEMAQKRINQFKVELEVYSKTRGKAQVTLLPIIDIMSKLHEYNGVLLDDFCFSYSNGVPFLRKIILSVLLQTSKSLTTL